MLKVSRQAYSKPKLARFVGFALLLMLLAVVLSGCSSYIGADPPCQGANANAPGCPNPSTGIKDEGPKGLAWFIGWFLDIMKAFMSAIAMMFVRIGTSVFWLLFTGLGSTDFAACATGGGTNQVCAAYSAFDYIRVIAFVGLPLIITWKVFKSHLLGAAVTAWNESAVSYLAKFAIGAAGLGFLHYLITAAFGLSNLLFFELIGGVEGLHNAITLIIGNEQSSGIAASGNIQSIGLMFLVMCVCICIGLIFIFLGLVFFLRTIIVYILFAISPLAVIAGLNDEFRGWFNKWLGAIQAMLIAPLVVGVCLRLVIAFVTEVPAPHQNPPLFFLNLIYICAFMFISAVLMFKIAGSVGSAMFGAVVSVASFGAGLAVGAVTGGAGGAATAGLGAARGGATGAGNAMAGNGMAGSAANMGGRSGGFNPSSPTASSASSGYTGKVSGYLPSPSTESSGSSPNAYATQQQSQTLSAMRSLNEQLSRGSRSPITVDSVETHPNTPRRRKFSYGTYRNVQSFGHFSAREAGYRAPYFDLPNDRSGEGDPDLPPTIETDPANYPVEQVKPPTVPNGAKERVAHAERQSNSSSETPFTGEAKSMNFGSRPKPPTGAGETTIRVQNDPYYAVKVSRPYASGDNWQKPNYSYRATDKASEPVKDDYIEDAITNPYGGETTAENNAESPSPAVIYADKESE